MFSQNGKRPILTDFRGCFPHAVVINYLLQISIYIILFGVGLYAIH